MADKSSKTEKPTPKRREKAREKGQVARSRDLTNFFGSAAAILVLIWEAPDALLRFRVLYVRVLNLASSQQLEPASPVLFWTSMEVIRWAVPAMLAGLAVSIGVGYAQGGFVFAPEAVSFKFERLNPATNLQQMFSLTALSGLLKSLLPFGAILYVCGAVWSERWSEIVHASLVDLPSFAHLMTSMGSEIFWKCGLVLGVWAGVDYFLNWRKHESELSMSREEMREEFKESDGNPTMKGRIRKLQRQSRRQHMSKSVETATVVVTNPTHFAVALKYEMDMDVPVVVAKGQDLWAQEIKEIARWHGVAIMENRPLAQTLYRTVEVGFPIPAKLFVAVADILAIVFRAKAQAEQASRKKSTDSKPGGPR